MNKISEKKVKELINELKELSSLKDSKRKIQYWYQQKNNVVNSNNMEKAKSIILNNNIELNDIQMLEE